MEWIGWISLIIILCYSSYPGKVNKLEKKLKRLERGLKEEREMSKIINSLLNKKCKLRSEDGFAGVLGNTEVECTVLECDDEWIKISYTDKKEKKFIKILRIDDISSVELIEE